MRFLLLAAAAPVLAAGAFAQDDDTLVTDTIIVTAPGPDRSADELIGNATAIDRDELIDRLAGSLGDTLDKEPGVASTFFGQGVSRPVLRGLGAERVQVLTNGIGVIDASAASPDHQVSADGIDAERVEILRGPAALAYGGQAIGGVVNVVDGLIAEDMPDEPLSGEGFAAFNSVNEGTELGGRAEFAAGPIVFTLSGSLRDFENYDIPGFAESSLLRALEEAEHGDEDHEDDDHDEDEDHDHEEEEEVRDTLENSFLETQTLAAGLSYVGERGFLGVAIRQQTADYGLPGHSHEHGHEGEDHDEDDHAEEDHDEGEEHGEEEENPFIDLEHTRIDIRGGYAIDNGFFTDVVGSLAIVDYEHTEFEAPGEPGTVYGSEGIEGRLELDHEVGGFKGAFGVQYTDKELTAFGEEAFISPTDTKSFGLFVYETREWDTGVGVEAGLRFETTELDNISQGTRSFDLFNASFGAHRHFDSGWFLGAQVAYTERAPNESELFADGPHLATEQFEVGDASLSKESGLNLEGTARWRSDNLAIGANLFVTEFNDFTFLTPGLTLEDGALVDEADGLPVFLFVQDDATFTGGEVYGAYIAENGLAGADWTFDGSVDFVTADLEEGGNVPFIPPLTFNGDVEAEWDMFALGASLSLAGEQDDPGLGQLETDGYTLLDLRASLNLSAFGLGLDGTKAFIEARNVTDEEIRYATSVLKDVAPAPGQNVRVGIRGVF